MPMMVSQGSDMRVLVLGGTTEGAALARALAEGGIDAVVSLAGRTADPAPLPLPVRVGGFGGAEGLADWLRQAGVTHVIDATHPFAARISANAVAACTTTGLPLVALERPAWAPVAGDRWTCVPDMAAATAALPARPATVFLAIGRQEIPAFAGMAHRFVLRLVDPPQTPLLPRATVIVARGPFTVAGDLALMREHGVQVVVSKNAGGAGARAKLDAARALGLPVVMVDRPAIPPRATVASVDAALRWLHQADLGA
jgi:precorrin-6A/cobalt-precorrin-6A reductase